MQLQVTCGVHASVVDRVIEDIQNEVDQASMQARIIVCGKTEWRYVDIVSAKAGKQAALEYALLSVIAEYAVPLELCYGRAESGCLHSRELWQPHELWHTYQSQVFLEQYACCDALASACTPMVVFICPSCASGPASFMGLVLVRALCNTLVAVQICAEAARLPA